MDSYKDLKFVTYHNKNQKMLQRDLIKEQIEQLGKAIGKILADFLELKSIGKVAKGIETSNQQLQSQLDINIETVTSLTKPELKDYLQHRKLTANHIEMLSEYLKEIGIEEMKTNKEKAKISLEKAILLLDVADETTRTMSFDRRGKKANIENLLQQL